MKAIATLIIFLLIVFTAQAKNAGEVSFENGFATSTIAVFAPTDNQVARLYRNKNSMVKKALSFTTKRNSAKLA